MKRFIAAVLAALLSISAYAVTLYPLGLMNPIGSTSGQFITSTGPTTAPTWTTVTLSGLGGVVSIANGGTGQTSAPAALTALGAASLGTNTFTGTQVVSASNGAIALNDTSAANKSQVVFQNNSVTAWALSNSSSGSNGWTLDRFVSGSFVNSPISVANSTGVVSFTSQPIIPTAAAGTNTTQAATTAFVTTAVAAASTPYFQVALAANQTITNSTYTKINFDTVNFDASAAWSATNKRWTPLKAGKYKVTISTAMQAVVTSAQFLNFAAAIYKNGTITYGGNQGYWSAASGTMFGGPTASAIVSMNGSTDYIEGWAFAGGNSGAQVNLSLNQTYFEAQYIGP